MGRSPGGFFLKAAQNTVLGYHFPGFSRGLVHYFPTWLGWAKMTKKVPHTQPRLSQPPSKPVLATEKMGS
jgi:hypothetical protein